MKILCSDLEGTLAPEIWQEIGKEFKVPELDLTTRDIADFNKEYVEEMLEYWDNNLTNIFRRQKDILVADAVLEMFRRRENIENFNKKALYIMIREMSGSKTQHITRIVNTMKKYHKNLFSEYLNNGMIDTQSTGSFL